MLRALLATPRARSTRTTERELIALREACFASEDMLEGVRAFAEKRDAALAGPVACAVVCTWNVNSLRARLPRVLELLEKHAPDVVLLQETKVAPDQYPEAELRGGRVRLRPSQRRPVGGRRDPREGGARA